MNDIKQKAKVSLEDALMEQLRYCGFDKQNLADLVKIAATLHRSGVQRPRGFPLGIPVIDSLRLSGDVELDKIGQLLQDILPKTPRFNSVVVFPKGIPWPEVYNVNIVLGTPAQMSHQNFGF